MSLLNWDVYSLYKGYLMTISTHYLLTADFEVLHRFYTHPVTGMFTATTCISGEDEWVETSDIVQGRKLWRSVKAAGGMVVSHEVYIDYLTNGSI